MITFGSVVLIFGLLVGTRPGRRILYSLVANVVHSGIVNEDPGKQEEIYEGPLGDDYINPELVEKDEEGNVLVFFSKGPNRIAHERTAGHDEQTAFAADLLVAELFLRVIKG